MNFGPREMEVPVLKLAEKNTNFMVSDSEGSEFDSVLMKKWKEADDNGVFRYKLNIENSKVLEGKYQFLLQLNRDRREQRRAPEMVGSMAQPFDPTRFNFTKLAPGEIILRINDDDHVIAVNVSPLESGHSLFLVDRLKCLPQVVTRHSLWMAIGIFFLSKSPYIRVGFNSLFALASVNHLHWHIYYLEKKMLLESIDLEDFMGPVKTIKDYPAKGFCVKYSSVGSIENLTKWSFLIINWLQDRSVAHNVYITRGRTKFGEYCDLRVYIWPRKSYAGVKDYREFVPAVCEFFGHFVIGSKEDFEILTEDEVARKLTEFTEESFSSLIKDLRDLISRETKGPQNVSP